jgi:cation:H+ antiporter
MALAIGLLALGGLLLYLGAEWMVKGAAGLARVLGISPLVVGLTIVAYGTSAPELVVSSIAVLQGDGPLALGNVVGSNIANIGLILGVTALVSPIAVEGGLVRWELPVLVVATAALAVLLLDGAVGRIEAVVLLAAAVTFTVVTLLRGSRSQALEAAALVEQDAEVAGAPSGEGLVRLALIAAVGLALLLAGGKIFVMGAIDLAILLGMSEKTVGLTIVAFGTSLPELAACVIAAVRGHAAIAVGNVLGSNIFNVIFVLGGAGLLRPVEGTVHEMRLSLVVVGVLTLAAVVLLRKERTVSRLEGGVLAAGYLGFLALLAA